MIENNYNNKFFFMNFHDISIEECQEIICRKSRSPGIDDFIASNQILNVMRIAKAYRNTPMGVEYESDNSQSIDSPQWVAFACRNPDALFDRISELKDYLASSGIPFDRDLAKSVDWCLDDWKIILSAPDNHRVTLNKIDFLMSGFSFKNMRTIIKILGDI